MSVTKIKRGLDLPINGAPSKTIDNGNNVSRVAIVGTEYVGMKPTMEVTVGDKVKLGQTLFTDKKNPGVKFTSPGSGKVSAINRGARRAFQSIVIDLEGDEEETFEVFSTTDLDSADPEKVRKQLIDSGLWTTIRTRPFSKSPAVDSQPHSIFITAMDTNPLAPDMETIIADSNDEFTNGIKVLSRLCKKIFLCKASGAKIPSGSGAQVEEFQGPHPAGLPGTHIHFLDPVSNKKTVWYIGAQDVIAIGHLFITGTIRTERIIALAGPGASSPRLLRTRLGAQVSDLVKGELKSGDNRVISGSVLTGFEAEGPFDFLGRFSQSISVLTVEEKRRFLGWISISSRMYSVKNVLLSCLSPGKKFDFTPEEFGGKRPIVPVGSYEKVMPLDIEPTYLLRALAVDDLEEAEKLGCLELDEEDLALCTFVCPSKIEHGSILRRNLTLIEKEG